jgi:probable phosphoglycerate mutase
VFDHNIAYEIRLQQAIDIGKKILKEGIRADEILYWSLIRATDTAKHISEIKGAKIYILVAHNGISSVV